MSSNFLISFGSTFCVLVISAVLGDSASLKIGRHYNAFAFFLHRETAFCAELVKITPFISSIDKKCAISLRLILNRGHNLIKGQGK